ALGDEPMPRLGPGGPVRWLGTPAQLKRTARSLGFHGHFYYFVPKGFTFGQYLLGHADDATAIAPSAHVGLGDRAPLARGDIVELDAGQSPPEWRAAASSLASELGRSALGAAPVAEL